MPEREVEFWIDGEKFRMREMNGAQEANLTTLYTDSDGKTHYERIWYGRFSVSIIEPLFTAEKYAKMSERQLKFLRAHWERLNGISDNDFLGSFVPPSPTSSTNSQPSSSTTASPTTTH